MENMTPTVTPHRISLRRTDLSQKILAALSCTPQSEENIVLEVSLPRSTSDKQRRALLVRHHIAFLGSKGHEDDIVLLCVATRPAWTEMARKLHGSGVTTPYMDVVAPSGASKVGRGGNDPRSYSMTLHADLKGAVQGTPQAANDESIQAVTDHIENLGGTVMSRWTRVVGTLTYMVITLPEGTDLGQAAHHPQIRHLAPSATISVRTNTPGLG